MVAPTIFLGPAPRVFAIPKTPAPRPDIPMTRMPIILERKKPRGRKETIAEIKSPALRKAVGFVTSPRLTALLAGTLGGLVGGPITAIKSFAVGGLAAGALAESPRLRQLAKEKILRPEKGGEFLGGFIEDPTLPTRDKTFKEKVVSGLKTGGLIGAGLTAAVVGGAAIKKAAETIRERGLPGLPGIPSIKKPSETPPIAFLPAPPSLTPTTPPLGAVEKPIEEKAVPPALALPSIKITNKPQNIIDIRFSKSRKFINQQVIVK